MTAVDAVRQLQRDYDDLKALYDLVPTDQRALVEENTRLRKFADSMAFLATNYDTPEISLACRNHVDLIKHMNQALELLGADLS